MEFTDPEKDVIRQVYNAISDESIVEELASLAEREKKLLGEMSDDPAMREITVSNFAILCAAADRFRVMSRDRKAGR